MRVNPLLIIIVTILLICPSVCLQSDSDAMFGPGFQLDMVCPTGTEGITLKNNTPVEQDLDGWSLSDGEGKITFIKSIAVKAWGRISIMSQTPSDNMHLERIILYDDTRVTVEDFSLNDNGDDIYLMDPDGDVVDSFYYGDCTPDGMEPFPKIPKGKVAQRNRGYDYLGEDDKWILMSPGRTMYHICRTYTDCDVTPFSFPESDGEEILSCIQDAEEIIRISMYTFDNTKIASALKHALDRGVEVRILMEGQPAGGIDNNEVQTLTSLWKSGADIKMIASKDSYKRYQYVHTKYAIIDNDTTVITSENWTNSAFKDNRGWGVTIMNEECAEYLSSIFDLDFKDMGDLTDFRNLYPTALPLLMEPYEPKEYDIQSYKADVSPVLCPDYSRSTLKEFIRSSTYRMYSQQLNVQYSWIEEEDNPLQWMRELGRSGVNTRILVDVTYDSPNDKDCKDGYGLFNEYMYDDSVEVRYETSKSFGLAHNKGMVSDDRVWIGSMNWTDNSIDENRELSVIIDSDDITEFFLKRFLSDWGTEYHGTNTLNVDIIEKGNGQYLLDASGSDVMFGSAFYWDLDCNGEYERSGIEAGWKFYNDTHCILKAVDPEGRIMTYEFDVAVNEKIEEKKEFVLEGPVKYVPLVLLIGGIVMVRRLIK